MDGLAVGIVSAAGAILAAVAASLISYFNSRSDRRARAEAERRADLAEQRKQELDGLRVMLQEQRAELERKEHDLDDYRAREEARQEQMDYLRRQLADERRDRRLAEDAWHRLRARHPEDD